MRKDSLFTLTMLTEHFMFSPEMFARQGMDTVNIALYQATQQAEHTLTQHLTNHQHITTVIPYILVASHTDYYAQGIFKLETLLEQAIDKHFDLFEIYLLRNTFHLPPHLLPYLTLDHQAHLEPSLQATDAHQLTNYQAQLDNYHQQLEIQLKLQAVSHQQSTTLLHQSNLLHQLEFLSSHPKPLPTTTISTHLPPLNIQLDTLLTTEPPRTTLHKDVEQPWREGRMAYINATTKLHLEQLHKTSPLETTTAQGSRKDAEVCTRIN